MTLRTEYDLALTRLQDELGYMSQLVEQALIRSIQSLVEQNVELAQQVIDADDEIDQLQIKIEDQCLKLIALQQPAGKDLRKISVAIRLTVEFERMADIAVGIAKKTKLVSGEPFFKPLIDIPRMAVLCQQMTATGLDAYIKEDASLAVKMSEWDSEIDALFKQMFREVLTFMLENPRNITQGTHLLFVGRFLERYGDHATNVAEAIVYLVTGERKNLND